MKTFGILFLIFLFIGCNSTEYYFPNKTKEIESKEIENLIVSKFRLKHTTYSDQKCEIKIDSILIFKKKGILFNENKKIGTWNSNRYIHLNKLKMDFYISNLGKNSIFLTSRFKEKNDTVIKTIIYRFVNMSNDETEIESELDF